MTHRANPVRVRVAARGARAAGRDVGCADEEAAVLVVDHNVACAIGAVAFHAAARIEQVLAVFELPVSRREGRLDRRQLNDAMELAIGELADDASGRGNHDDESRETRDNYL